MKKLLLFFLVTVASLFIHTAQAKPPKGIKLSYHSIPVLILEGTDKEMGYAYGSLLKKDLRAVLFILKNFYIEKKHLSYFDMIAQGDRLYNRFPSSYQTFLKGVSEGSHISFNDIKILNAMETMGELLSKSEGRCSFLFLPENKKKPISALIGRNYDYPPPFDQIAAYLTITILKTKHAIPTAIIALAGEIYCPTCINANHLFMELNNGMVSGGYTINYKNQSLLTHMLSVLQHSASLSDAQQKMKNFKSDYSLIVNLSDTKKVDSFEYSTDSRSAVWSKTNQSFVSTNFFLNPAWKNLPFASDQNTYYAITRRNNLLKLSKNLKESSIYSFEALMDKDIKHGGAKGKLTIYQLIFNPNSSLLYVKTLAEKSWVAIPLGQLF